MNAPQIEGEEKARGGAVFVGKKVRLGRRREKKGGVLSCWGAFTLLGMGERNKPGEGASFCGREANLGTGEGSQKNGARGFNSTAAKKNGGSTDG